MEEDNNKSKNTSRSRKDTSSKKTNSITSFKGFRRKRRWWIDFISART